MNFQDILRKQEAQNLYTKRLKVTITQQNQLIVEQQREIESLKAMNESLNNQFDELLYDNNRV